MHKSKRRAKSPSPEQALFCPWLNSLPNKTFAGVEQKLHHEIEAYMKYLQPDSHETATRAQAFQRVKDCVKSLFNQSAINTFGSSATGLSSPTGDIDIVISTPYELKPHVRKKLLFDISQRLRYHNIANEVLVNHWARIPIVTFTTVPELGSFSVDIGINNNDGLSAVKVVKYYLDTMPALKPLVLVVKGLLSRHGLNDASKGGLGSYGIIWMCVSLLQRNPGGQPDSYFTHPSDTESLGYLVVDFMKHYGLEFDFTEDFISVSSGQILKKSQGGDWINKKTLDHICIQDPCQPENDVGRPASKTRAIIAAFEGAYRSLTEAASVTDESLLARLLGSPWKGVSFPRLPVAISVTASTLSGHGTSGSTPTGCYCTGPGLVTNGLSSRTTKSQQGAQKRQIWRQKEIRRFKQWSYRAGICQYAKRAVWRQGKPLGCWATV
ncbi:Nucleotidyltransferase [Fistulina hepatica ATCC 64428]|uniref:polynucleotide adenylyltransferase n=1 Tax=Fistulina hepatica ATCC 64428 TaxID=1128425 RepID=A0A0D7AMF8_9AGAR|nr:Nucleotidyltransferase [Fistulina hepatica ATCC 64428]